MLILCSATSWYGMVVRSYSSFKLLKQYVNAAEAGPSTTNSGLFSALLRPSSSSSASASAADWDEAKIKEALHFWVAFALLALFEQYVELLVSWLPLYSFAKLCLLWYIILPQTKGSTVLFENFIEPRFRHRVRDFEHALLGALHSHVLTYTSVKDYALLEEHATVDGRTDEELEGLLQHAEQINALVARERQRRSSSSQNLLMVSATSSSSSSSQEEFVVVTPPLPQGPAPASPTPRQQQQQRIQPSHLPARGFVSSPPVVATVTTTTARMSVVEVLEAEYVPDDEEDEEEASFADETLNLIDSPSATAAGLRQRLSGWLPSSPAGVWPGMLSFAAATPAKPVLRPAPSSPTAANPSPPQQQQPREVIVVEDDDAHAYAARSSSMRRRARAPSGESVDSPVLSPHVSSFTNRILTRRQLSLQRQQQPPATAAAASSSSSSSFSKRS